MSVPRLATLAVALSALVPASANAMDDYLRASSRAPTPIKLCGETDDDRIKTAMCKEHGYDRLVAQIDKAFDAALAKTPANIRPLLQRDQAWFNEMILEAADLVVEMDEGDIRAGFAETLQPRADALESMADGIGRTGFAGRWTSAFGGIAVTPAEGDAYRLADRHPRHLGPAATGSCGVHGGALSSSPRPARWLAGSMLPDEAAPAKACRRGHGNGRCQIRLEETAIKMRRQGETLRLAIDGRRRWLRPTRPARLSNWSSRSPRVIFPAARPRPRRQGRYRFRDAEHSTARAPRPRATRRSAPIRTLPTTTGG